MWACSQCKATVPYDAIEVEQEHTKLVGVCVTCYTALIEKGGIEATGLQALHDRQTPPADVRYGCISCGGSYPLTELRLDLGYRQNGEPWRLGWCVLCMDERQRDWLDQQAEKWMARQRFAA